MTNEDFFKLSEQEVKNLNGSNSEDSFEAWRAGFNYARKIVKDSINDFLKDELREFNFTGKGSL